MEKIAVEWTMYKEPYLNIVKLSGKMKKNYGLTVDIVRSVLLRSACDIIEIASKINGTVLLEENPPKKIGTEFVYTQIIFRDTESLLKFLQAIDNKLSKWGLIFIYKKVRIMKNLHNL